jgi:hypothetical protein
MNTILSSGFAHSIGFGLTEWFTHKALIILFVLIAAHSIQQSMTPLIYIGIGLAVAALGAYTMAVQGATQHWGVRLSGGPTEEDLIRERMAQGAGLAEARGYAMGAALTNRGFQDALTPTAQNARNILFGIGLFSMFVLGAFYFRWYWGIAGFFGTFISTGILKSFFPASDSRFFRDMLVSSLKQRQGGYTSSGDTLRAAACRELIGKFHEIENPHHLN